MTILSIALSALELDEIHQRLSTSSGASGSGADYLFGTCEALRAQ